MSGEFVAYDTQQGDAEDERQIEREQARAALQNASNELVDVTVQTPWERQREFAVEHARRIDDATLQFPARPSSESMRAFRDYMARAKDEQEGSSNV